MCVLHSFFNLSQTQQLFAWAYTAFISFLWLQDKPRHREELAKGIWAIGGKFIQHTGQTDPLYPESTNLRVSITVWLTSCLFCFDSALCSCWMKKQFTCLVKSKPVKQDFVHTVILPPMVSVLCSTQIWPTFVSTENKSVVTFISKPATVGNNKQKEKNTAAAVASKNNQSSLIK